MVESRRLVVEAARVANFLHAVGHAPLGPVSDVAELHGTPVPPGFLFYVSAFGAEALHREVGLTYQNGLFAGNKVDVLAPVRVGEELTVTASLGQTTEPAKAGLAFTDIHCEYLRDGGVPVLRETSTVVRFSGEGPGAPAAKSGAGVSLEPDPGKLSGPFRSGRLDVAYMAVALRDPNPVHVDDDFAAARGLARPILHGTFAVFNIVSAASEHDWAGITSYQVRLRSPICLEEDYTVEVNTEGVPITAKAYTSDGRLVADGEVTVQ